MFTFRSEVVQKNLSGTMMLRIAVYGGSRQRMINDQDRVRG